MLSYVAILKDNIYIFEIILQLMRLYKIFSGALLVLLVFNSCSNKTEQYYPVTIQLNLSNSTIDSMRLSEIAYKVEYIPLQTTQSSILSSNSFNSLVISKDNIFIQNESDVLKFNKNGNFENTLFTVGRGPEEATARCFTVDENNQLVYVFDHLTKDVKIYNFDGKFIGKIVKQINTPYHWTYSIGFFNNTLLVTTPQGPKSKYLYSCFDLRNDSIRVIYNNLREYEKSQLDKESLSPYDYAFQITDTTIMFKEWFNDTILKMGKNFKIEPKYIINLGNHQLEWKTWRDHGMFDIAGGPPIGYRIQSFCETKSYLFLTAMSFKSPQIFAVYNKNNDSVKLFTRQAFKWTSDPIYLKNDLDNIVDFPLMNRDGYFCYYDKCLYSIIEAKDFHLGYTKYATETKKSTSYLSSMTHIFNYITEFSNPVIIRIYLK